MGHMMSPPVKKGEDFNLKIEALGKKGDGISKIQGYTIFIPKAKIDETVKVKIITVMPRFAFAEIIKEESEEDVKEVPDDETPEDTEDFGE